MTARRPDREPPPADVEIGATARARRLRFRSKPETRVEFEGEPGVESDSHTERENLPEEVEPGKVYRDVRVRWTAGARIDDAEVQELVDDLAAKGRSKGATQSKES
jgi:hypothetical protein